MDVNAHFGFDKEALCELRVPGEGVLPVLAPSPDVEQSPLEAPAVMAVDTRRRLSAFR